LGETERRREKQQAYNEANGITPESIRKSIGDVLDGVFEADYVTIDTGDDENPHLVGHNLKAYLGELESRMLEAASNLDFEEAARLRDELHRLENADLGLASESAADRRERAKSARSGARSTKGRAGTRQRRGKTSTTSIRL
jgi:excinuclease ABC subunit B